MPVFAGEEEAFGGQPSFRASSYLGYLEEAYVVAFEAASGDRSY